MIVVYMQEVDVPVWKVEDQTLDGKALDRWWNVRLWTGQVKSFRRRAAAITEYWR